MKKFILLLVLIVGLQSCNSQNEGVTMLSPTQAKENLAKDASIQLLDVRTADEFSTGHIDNAENSCVTTDEFIQKMPNLDKEKPIYVYCKSGNRSAKATKILVDNGFTNVFEVIGGITAWQSDGLEVTQ